ncbi:DUF1778 domain-containing protein [Salinisphaera sp.]|uniref:type II toxin-antitoxin system TacA family antitoxin n=1 Tax=Salinisphaera sp. TaxID=1914330 RepID=UPI002D786B25|nr:DUF1778 domain-containing protein [Salinisphaera sp.]HET7314041.1 DUF1778 domain-containing protein [Salinisphaera sp.]
MTGAARLDLRLDARDKDRIARAAELGGISVSTFVRNAALHAASDAIAGEETVSTGGSLAARLRGRASKRMSRILVDANRSLK